MSFSKEDLELIDSMVEEAGYEKPDVFIKNALKVLLNFLFQKRVLKRDFKAIVISLNELQINLDNRINECHLLIEVARKWHDIKGSPWRNLLHSHASIDSTNKILVEEYYEFNNILSKFMSEEHNLRHCYGMLMGLKSKIERILYACSKMSDVDDQLLSTLQEVGFVFEN